LKGYTFRKAKKKVKEKNEHRKKCLMQGRKFSSDVSTKGIFVLLFFEDFLSFLMENTRRIFVLGLRHTKGVEKKPTQKIEHIEEIF
jgi:hypothetical protein